MSNNYDFKTDLLSRIKNNKTTRWIRFGIVSLIYLLWVGWLGNWWFLLGWFLLFDIYITGFIPFTWWKRSKNKAVRTVMGWVDAIVYSLILVYFIFAFVGQNYQIPSSSLEKTLLTGDYLWVNKMLYGPRVPMTLVNFPLVHNKLPIFDCDSYLDSPSNSYHRLKGIRNVESGDIVVFNFPAGDTVMSKYEESPEYYYYLISRYGREYVLSRSDIYGTLKYRPVDRRQNFVKRAVGLPGETIRIVSDTIYINGRPQPYPENVQFTYIFTSDRIFDEDIMLELELTPSDVNKLNFSSLEREILNATLPSAGTSQYIYAMPLTRANLAELSKRGYINDVVKFSTLSPAKGDEAFLFPWGACDDWTLNDYGGDNGLWIPKKGESIDLNADTWAIYNRCIRNYEGHTDAYLAEDGRVFINGQPQQSYTFAMDYYFMMGDNRDASQDSRFWGFVPEDHIVGSPIFVIASFDRERSLFNGGFRWNRIFRDANPDK